MRLGTILKDPSSIEYGLISLSIIIILYLIPWEHASLKSQKEILISLYSKVTRKEKAEKYAKNTLKLIWLPILLTALLVVFGTSILGFFVVLALGPLLMRNLANNSLEKSCLSKPIFWISIVLVLLPLLAHISGQYDAEVDIKSEFFQSPVVCLLPLQATDNKEPRCGNFLLENSNDICFWDSLTKHKKCLRKSRYEVNVFAL